MFIENTEQNLIKIKFNANEEEIFLADMLKIASSGLNGVIAQVIEIQSPEQGDLYNTAVAKILFTLQLSGKLTSWQGNIPGKDFKIGRVRPNELLSITGTDKVSAPITIGSLASNPQTLININALALKKPSLVIGDKDSSRNDFLKQLAFELADKNSKVVIADKNGDFIDMEEALVLKAGKDIKLPLDIVGLENLYNKTLSNVSAETQANIENIFSEIEEYLISEEVSHIPFSSFLEAINAEFEENSTPELSFLNNNLTKLYRRGLFADNQREINKVFNSLIRKNIIVIDLSEIIEDWKDEFVNTIIRLNKNAFKKDFFLINSNINDSELARKLLNQGINSGISPVFSEQHDSDILNEIYPKIENIFAFTAFNASKISNLQYFFPMLGDSEAIMCGKVTNNVPVYIKVNSIDEEYPAEIIIDQSFINEVQPNNFQPVEKTEEVVENYEEEEHQDDEDYQEELEPEIYEDEEEVISEEEDEEELQYTEEYQEEPESEVYEDEQEDMEEDDEGYELEPEQNYTQEDDLDLLMDEEEDESSLEETEEYEQSEEELEEPESEVYEDEQEDMEEDDEGYELEPEQNYTSEDDMGLLMDEEEDESSLEETEEYEQSEEELQYTEEELEEEYSEDNSEEETYEEEQQPSENFENEEGDENFDYSSSEEFQDESVLDYINNEEEPEEVDKPIKRKKSPMPDVPIYQLGAKRKVNENIIKDEDLIEGTIVRHKKYGEGVIKKVIGYSDKKLCSIQFTDVGRRLLDPKLAELELVSKI